MKKKFHKNIFDKQWPEKELKQRIRHVSENIRDGLPLSYKKSITILKPVSLNFSGLFHLVFPDYIELCGLDDLKTSVSAMEFFTINSSSEFPVRHFIIKYPDEMLKQLTLWSKSDNEHVRRLASEGCRPRLPWAIALPDFKADPSPILPILERLKSDQSEYVRRSVANNLNDISKDNPALTIKLAKKWHGKHLNTDWVVKHGCRTLLKNGEAKVLRLFGYVKPISISVNELKLVKKVKLGEELNFNFKIATKNKKLGKLRIEYMIHFALKNNKTGKKVFKISEGDFLEKEKFISKKHSFRFITTRKYYPGEHGLSIVVNGVEMANQSFSLTE